jgi:hypothetical protein
MASETQQLRQDITATRAELARNVDRLADQTSPGRLARRVMGGLRALKDKTMGTSEQVGEAAAHLGEAAADRLHGVGEAAAERLHGVGEAVKDGRRQVARATQGSPIGVGLMAFGGGLLAAALIPETEAERRAARGVSERVGPMVAPLVEAGRAVAGDIRGTVQSAAGQVRDAAAEGAGHVQSAAAEGVAGVRTAAMDAAEQARIAAERAIDESAAAAGFASRRDAL